MFNKHFWIKSVSGWKGTGLTSSNLPSVISNKKMILQNDLMMSCVPKPSQQCDLKSKDHNHKNSDYLLRKFSGCQCTMTMAINRFKIDAKANLRGLMLCHGHKTPRTGFDIWKIRKHRSRLPTCLWEHQERWVYEPPVKRKTGAVLSALKKKLKTKALEKGAMESASVSGVFLWGVRREDQRGGAGQSGAELTFWAPEKAW